MSDTESSQAEYATCEEKYLHGLMCGSKRSKRNVQISSVEGRGRSAFARRNFKPGNFVREYGSVVHEKAFRDWGEERNNELGVGCYCLDAVYNGKVYTFDAAPKINHPGRYINHARKHPNLILKKPVWIGKPPKGWLRIGLVEKSNIKGKSCFLIMGSKIKISLGWPRMQRKLPSH